MANKQETAQKIVAKILECVDDHIMASEGVTFQDWLFTEEGFQEFEVKLVDDVLLIQEGE